MAGTEDSATLQAYSQGRIGWRQACKELILLDIEELHAALEEHGLPLPEEEQVIDAEAPKRFTAFVSGRNGNDDE